VCFVVFGYYLGFVVGGGGGGGGGGVSHGCLWPMACRGGWALYLYYFYIIR